MKLELTGVGYAVDSREILRPIDLEIVTGQCCVLLGPNGAGKSTLMKIASGFLQPCCGEVLLDGKQIGAYTMLERARMLAVLTQRNELDFPFTAEEVIAMGRTPHGDTETENATVREVMDRLNIDGDRIYTSLSGGEKQLVQLARIFAQVWQRGTGSFLLLDEPVTALDLNHQQIVVAMLRKFADEGTGQLVVMHDINLAAECADKIALIADGELIAFGTPGDVLNADTLEATFSTPMIMLQDGEERFYKVRPQRVG